MFNIYILFISEKSLPSIKQNFETLIDQVVYSSIILLKHSSQSENTGCEHCSSLSELHYERDATL